MLKQHANKIPTNIQTLYDKITNQTTQCCKEHLDEKYAELIRYIKPP